MATLNTQITNFADKNKYTTRVDLDLTKDNISLDEDHSSAIKHYFSHKNYSKILKINCPCYSEPKMRYFEFFIQNRSSQ